MNEGADSTGKNSYNDPLGFWDYETSRCIRSESKKNSVNEQLDAVFNVVKKGQESVLLPTGEEYPIEAPPSHNEPSDSPTATCLARDFD